MTLTLLKNAQIVDGTTPEPADPVNIVIEDGIFKEVADAYNIEEVAERAFCRSMLPFVVAQLSLCFWPIIRVFSLSSVF